MQEYINNVNSVCSILLEGINRDENLNLKTKKDFFMYRMENSKMEFEFEEISYRLHGKGCVAFSNDFFLDWDFGYRSRWCGVDPWKLAMTLKKNKHQHSECFDGDLIKKMCEQAVEEGVMVKWFDQYYFVIPKNETFKPAFPEKYDTLIVEYYGVKWSIPRNKTIDRFIRKSNKVYKQIENSKDIYLLHFMLEEKEVYSIPYDDIGYPEEAIKIMSDDILRKLQEDDKVDLI